MKTPDPVPHGPEGDWLRLNEVFEGARVLPADRRPAYLAAACHDNPALLHEVEQLIASYECADTFLEKPIKLFDENTGTDNLPHVPERIGPYRITATLGEGGMGEVYRARDTKLGRDVAIKLLPRMFTSDLDRLARFEREARMLAALNHPHIGAIYGVEEADGIPALVLELVEGPTLADRLAKGRIPINESLTMARQIADALEAAHEKGIIHRDLKPANIKITSDGVVKVLDFGLAKVATGGSPPDLTQSPTVTVGGTRDGVILGTAAYMSPEQARGEAVDKRTDIWAFGCVLYEMLTGHVAFPGKTIPDTLAAILECEPNWALLPTTTVPAVRRLLERCLEKDSKGRLRDIGDAGIDLGDAITSSAKVAQLRKPMPRWIWGLTSGFVVVGLATGASALLLRADRAPGAVIRFTAGAPFGSTRRVMSTFAVSPDGAAIAFEATPERGVDRIFVRKLDQPEARPVDGTEGGSDPFWSPDGRALGFYKERGLYRVDLNGQPARRLCDVPGNDFAGGTWSPKGVIVFAPGGAGLHRIPEAGGTPTPITEFDKSMKEVFHGSPSFLPDGKHVLFLALAKDGGSRGFIFATSLDDPTRTKLVESTGGAEYADGWLLFTTAPPRALVAQRFEPGRLALQGAAQPVRDRLSGASTSGEPGFSVAANGVLVLDRPAPIRHRLTWVDRTGRQVGSVGPVATVDAFALAPDERHVAAEVIDDNSRQRELWLFESGSDESSQLTFERGSTRRPLWAPDGRRVYYTQRVKGVVFRTLVPRASAETLFENPDGLQSFEDITRDGRFFVFSGEGISFQSVSNPAERRTLVRDQFPTVQPRLSPNQRWLAYLLGVPSGAEIFVQPLDRPGERVKVSPKGGFGPVWRDDGRELFYESADAVMAAPVSDAGGKLRVGSVQKLFSVRTQGLAVNQPHNVEVAEHGQKFLVNTIVDDSDNVPLEVTLNWTSALPR